MKQYDTNFSDSKLYKALSGHFAKAKTIITDRDKSLKIISDVYEKLQKSPSMDAVIEDIRLLCSMVVDYVKKKYTEIPVATIVMLVAALLYFLSPIDLIPDFIIGLGLIDDLAVITFVIKAAHSDIQRYKKWKEAKAEDGDIIEGEAVNEETVNEETVNEETVEDVAVEESIEKENFEEYEQEEESKQEQADL